MSCPHHKVELVRLGTGEVVRGICADPLCAEEIIVETRADGTTWRWLLGVWREVTEEQVNAERIEP